MKRYPENTASCDASEVRNRANYQLGELTARGLRKDPTMTQLEEDKIDAPSVATVDLKLEVVVIPVSDVDRAKEFYGRRSSPAKS